MTGPALVLAGVTKRFGSRAAVNDVTLRVPTGSLTALLGPSGCGKSTTLALVAGLIDPDTGDIHLDGHSVLGVPAERRPTGLVFQRPLLFPHLTVEANIAFGLRMRRHDRHDTRRRVAAILDTVHLTGLGHRRIGELSGGQEQRVALARALILRPRILLLDEPFSQLDTVLRTEMRRLVRTLHDETTMTTIFVTHDQIEAVDIADTISLMLDGRIAGHGPPRTFYTNPPSLAAARFFGVTNEITGTAAAGLFISHDGAVRQQTTVPDGPAVQVIRPEALTITDQPGPHTITGIVRAARFAGTHTAIEITSATGLRLELHQPIHRPVTPGATIHVAVPHTGGTVFPAEP